MCALNREAKSQHFFRDSNIYKLYAGGNFGGSFGRYAYINISPYMGYNFSKYLSAGTGASYEYFHDGGNQYSTSIYGGSMFFRISFFHNIDEFIAILQNTNFIIEIEYEFLNLESKHFGNGLQQTDRYWLHSFLTGIGIEQKISPRWSSIVVVLWNTTHSDYFLPYFNPTFNIGFQYYFYHGSI